MYSGQRPEAIDTRWVFRVYAALACLSGLLLLLWGPMWFGPDLAGQQWGKAALIRVLGSTVIGAGCCAAGFAAVDNPHARRVGLCWFALGHTVVYLVVLIQRVAIWDSGLAHIASAVLGSIVFVLFYVWSTSEGVYAGETLISFIAGAAADPAENLRSRYEQQIREAARQEERNRLARDLHDSVKQQIFVIQTAAATAQARFDQDQAGTKEALEQARASPREAMTEMQVMMDQLRAVPLENTGLIESLKKQCEALGFRSGARVELKLGSLPPAEALPPGAHQAILRVAQEALANVGRHARAGSVLMSLGSVRGQVELRINDDGAGFDPSQDRRGQGLVNMRARADEFKGKFELISQPGAGTSVTLTIPYVTTEMPGQYRRKAVGWGILLVVSIAALVWTKQLELVGVSVLAAIGVVRYLVAYRRTQLRNEAAR